MIEPQSTCIKCPTIRPLVKVKVVPASFGLEGFEDTIWRATEDLLELNEEEEAAASTTKHSSNTNGDAIDNDDAHCKAITFVVAAPDLFTDPTLLNDEGDDTVSPRLSPQAEFELDTFRSFSSTLKECMNLFSKLEGVPLLNDTIDLHSYHPLCRNEDRFFPYPCVAVETKVYAVE